MFQGSSFRERLEAVIWASDDEVDGDVQPAANDNNDSDVPLVANDCNDEFDTDGLMNGSCMPEVIEEKAPVEGMCLRDLALRAYSLSWKEHNKVTKGEGEVEERVKGKPRCRRPRCSMSCDFREGEDHDALCYRRCVFEKRHRGECSCNFHHWPAQRSSNKKENEDHEGKPEERGQDNRMELADRPNRRRPRCPSRCAQVDSWGEFVCDRKCALELGHWGECSCNFHHWPAQSINNEKKAQLRQHWSSITMLIRGWSREL
jgi:hypothetical protein